MCRHGLTLPKFFVAIGPLGGGVARRCVAQVGNPELQVAYTQIDALKTRLDVSRIDMRCHSTSDQEMLGVSGAMLVDCAN